MLKPYSRKYREQKRKRCENVLENIIANDFSFREDRQRKAKRYEEEGYGKGESESERNGKRAKTGSRELGAFYSRLYV